MDKEVLLRYQVKYGYLTFYTDGTYSVVDAEEGNQLSQWNLTDGVLSFMHPFSTTWKTPWSSDEKATSILIDAIESELFLKSLLEKEK